MPSNPVTTILNDYPALVIDGALATELERRGCDLKDDLWSAKILLDNLRSSNKCILIIL